MALTRQTERKFNAVCYYVLCWILAAVGISTLVTYAQQGRFDLGIMLQMLQFALFMGFSHGVYDILILKDEMDCRAVWQSLLIRSLYFFAAISTSNVSTSKAVLNEIIMQTMQKTKQRKKRLLS